MLKALTLSPHVIGRAMMQYAVELDNDADFNRFSRVGNQLMNIGEPGYPKTIYDFSTQDIETINTVLEMFKK